MGSEGKRKRMFNRRHPPRVVVRFIPKPRLAKLLRKYAEEEGVSISKLVTDLLCEGFDIPQEER